MTDGTTLPFGFSRDKQDHGHPERKAKFRPILRPGPRGKGGFKGGGEASSSSRGCHFSGRQVFHRIVFGMGDTHGLTDLANESLAAAGSERTRNAFPGFIESAIGFHRVGILPGVMESTKVVKCLRMPNLLDSPSLPLLRQEELILLLQVLGQVMHKWTRGNFSRRIQEDHRDPGHAILPI
jgi:hypothetical protein